MARKKENFDLGELAEQLKSDRQQSSETASQETSKPASQESVEPGNQQASKSGNQQAKEPKAEAEKSMTIKLPQSLRDYYVGRIRMEGGTVREFLLEALEARYGTPEEPRS